MQVKVIVKLDGGHCNVEKMLVRLIIVFVLETGRRFLLKIKRLTPLLSLSGT
jgi:hypothetical protein